MSREVPNLPYTVTYDGFYHGFTSQTDPWSSVREYVGLRTDDYLDSELVLSCAEVGQRLVLDWLGSERMDRLTSPQLAIVFRAIVEVGAELYHRKNTKNAVAQFATPDGGTPVRIARDPMAAAYPLLRQLTGGGFA